MPQGYPKLVLLDTVVQFYDFEARYMFEFSSSLDILSLTWQVGSAYALLFYLAEFLRIIEFNLTDFL